MAASSSYAQKNKVWTTADTNVPGPLKQTLTTTLVTDTNRDTSNKTDLNTYKNTNLKPYLPTNPNNNL